MILARQKHRIERRMRIARNEPVPEPRQLRSGISYKRGMISKMVIAQDALPEPVRTMRGYTHASSLVSFCARQHAILLQEDTLLRHPRAGDRVTWKLGRAAEDHVRAQIIAHRDRDAIVGQWVCVCGREHYTGIFDPEHKACDRCRQQPTRYREMTLLDHDYNIKGNPDIVLIEQDGLLVVEVKSTSKTRFENMKQPLPEHKFQAAIYRQLLENAGYQVCDHVIVFVVSKDWAFSATRIYKEFEVPVKHEQLERQVQVMFERNRAAREEIAGGVMPSRICENMLTPMARDCPACISCFQRSG